jgi:hypothetical protein
MAVLMFNSGDGHDPSPSPPEMANIPEDTLESDVGNQVFDDTKLLREIFGDEWETPGGEFKARTIELFETALATRMSAYLEEVAETIETLLEDQQILLDRIEHMEKEAIFQQLTHGLSMMEQATFRGLAEEILSTTGLADYETKLKALKAQLFKPRRKRSALDFGEPCEPSYSSKGMAAVEAALKNTRERYHG